MAWHGYVVIAGVMQAGVALGVDGDLDRARPGAEGVQISRRIEVVVKIDNHAAVFRIQK
jgi:hypothetical protein